LIPRPETEELCVLISNHYRDKHNGTSTVLNGLDIGTGSGCIPVYLLEKHPKWTFTAMDISEDALDVAAENAVHVGVQDRLPQLEQPAKKRPIDHFQPALHHAI
jgi:release factor glutamine methyltransferase